jgi:hypothetical protein
MSLVSAIIGTAERVPLPGRARHHPRRRFIALCSRTATRLARTEGGSPFAEEMAARTVAEHADAANIWHHQVPAAFFAKVLGPNLKYSFCSHKEREHAAGGRGGGSAPDRRARRSRRQPSEPDSQSGEPTKAFANTR